MNLKVSCKHTSLKFHPPIVWVGLISINDEIHIKFRLPPRQTRRHDGWRIESLRSNISASTQSVVIATWKQNRFADWSSCYGSFWVPRVAPLGRKSWISGPNGRNSMKKATSHPRFLFGNGPGKNELLRDWTELPMQPIRFSGFNAFVKTKAKTAWKSSTTWWLFPRHETIFDNDHSDPLFGGLRTIWTRALTRSRRWRASPGWRWWNPSFLCVTPGNLWSFAQARREMRDNNLPD